MKKIKKEWAAPLLCGLAVVLLMRYVLFVGYVPSKSMEPTIPAGSIIWGWRLTEPIRRGDIVVFRHDGRTLVKRIAAIPGDTLFIDDKEKYVSIGVELFDTTRILTVPERRYFMLGDNRDDSLDSRFWSDPFISHENIIARVLQ